MGTRPSAVASPVDARERVPADTFVGTDDLAAAVARRGWNWTDLPGHIDAPRCATLLAGLSVAMPAHAPARNHLKRLRILPDTLPVLPGFSRVQLGDGMSMQLGEIDPWLQDRDLKVCRKPLRGGPADCQQAGSYRDPPLLVGRSYPLWFQVDRSPTDDTPRHIAWEVPWQAGIDGARIVQLLDSMEHPDCAWRITQVAGASVAETLPARSVTLHASSGVTGRLRVEADHGKPGCTMPIDRGNPPCWFETRVEEVAVRRALAGAMP